MIMFTSISISDYRVSFFNLSILQCLDIGHFSTAHFVKLLDISNLSLFTVAEQQLAGAQHASVLSWLYTVSIELHRDRASNIFKLTCEYNSSLLIGEKLQDTIKQQFYSFAKISRRKLYPAFQQKKTLSCLPASKPPPPPPYGGLEKEAQVLGSAFEKTKDFFQDLFPSLMNMLHCKWAMTRYFQTMILKSCKRTIRGWWPEVL